MCLYRFLQNTENNNKDQNILFHLISRTVQFPYFVRILFSAHRNLLPAYKKLLSDEYTALQLLPTAFLSLILFEYYQILTLLNTYASIFHLSVLIVFRSFYSYFFLTSIFSFPPIYGLRTSGIFTDPSA